MHPLAACALALAVLFLAAWVVSIPLRNVSIIDKGIRSALCVPIGDDVEVIGVLYADRQARHSPFQDADLRLLTLLANTAAPEDILLGATGFSGRELQQYTGHQGRFYMMGSMGCLPALGLGLARSRPRRTVFVLDGDGALLMKLGSLATIGHYRPTNLVHVLFDNQAYESTGSQPSLASGTDFCAVARACGYPAQEKVATPAEFRDMLSTLANRAKPLFVHVRVRCGTPAGLPRPEGPPEQMRDDLMSFLA